MDVLEALGGGRGARAGASVEVVAATAGRDLGPAAAARLRGATDGCALVLVFVPASADLPGWARELGRWDDREVVACTSAGGIGPQGYTDDVVAVGLRGPDVQVRCLPVGPLRHPAPHDDGPHDHDPGDHDRGDEGPGDEGPHDPVWTPGWDLAQVGGAGGGPAAGDARTSFAVMVVDGLCLAEEHVTSHAWQALGGIDLVGGSAGDDLRFEATSVLVDGRFRQGVGVVAVVSTAAPWRRFRVQHHVGDGEAVVVTDACPRRRLVRGLNGVPAAVEYARLVGVPVGRLTPDVFSRHPLVLRAGGGEWLRSIAEVDPHGALRFFSAAQTGQVLRLGVARDPLAALHDTVRTLREDLGGPVQGLVFDCVLRRVEFAGDGLLDPVGRVLAGARLAGMSTYGEQFDTVHVNQTMVGVAFGG